ILAELLTGRRPSASAAPPELRAGDPRSDELEAFLRRCLAPRDERFASAVDAHREIQRMVTGNPFSLYTANLALFLYKLLNPESQMATPSQGVEWENTNPVVFDPSATLAARRSAALETPLQDEPAASAASEADASARADSSPSEPPVSNVEEKPVEIAAAYEAVQAAALGANAILEQSDEEVEAAVASIQPVELVPEADRSVVVFRFPDNPVASVPAPDELAEAIGEGRAEATGPKVVIPREVVASPVRLWATAWTRPASALAAAAGLTLGAFLLFSQFREGVALRPRSRAAEPVAAAAPAPEPPANTIAASVPIAAPVAVVLSRSVGRVEPASAKSSPGARAGRSVPAASRQPAEDLRLRAALARIDADRVNAQQSAGDLFGEGRHNEQEGERLLRLREYPAAELAFSRAARLFQQAQEISWERRLRETDLTNTR
ncbi:MAG TPA: hypothetical protein VGO79_08770, partial [Thermoanaerobaculia bacterium]